MKNNIVQVVSYYPPHLGGMENAVKSISEELAKRENFVRVITSSQGYKAGREVNKKVHVDYLRSVEFAHTPIMFFLFFKLLVLPKNSLVHLHVAHAFAPEIVLIASKIRKFPYVAHIHLDVDPSGFFGFLLSPYKKIFLTQVLKNAAKIISLSDKQKETISNKYGITKSQIIVVPNGVDKSFFIKRRIKKNAKTTLLFVGRLVSQKNITRLINAVSLMKQNISLQIVGEGEEREKILKLIADLKLKNIQLLGKKSKIELISLYKQADIFVLPSNKEGIPLSLLEAMASGIPIVASNISGVNEILKGAGILVNDPSSETFAKSLDQLISNISLQKELSKKAYAKAKEYSWEKVTDQIELIYKTI